MQTRDNEGDRFNAQRLSQCPRCYYSAVLQSQLQFHVLHPFLYERGYGNRAMIVRSILPISSYLQIISTDRQTTWRRVLEMLTLTHLVKNFSVFYGIRRLISVFQSPPLVHILSQMHLVHTLPPDFFKIHYNIIFPSTPRPSEWSLPFKFSE